MNTKHGARRTLGGDYKATLPSVRWFALSVLRDPRGRTAILNMDAVTASNDETTDIQMAAGDDSVTVSAPAPAAVANGACAEHDEQEGTKAGVDWESMVQNEPGRTEIPLFLDACGRHEAASDR